MKHMMAALLLGTGLVTTAWIRDKRSDFLQCLLHIIGMNATRPLIEAAGNLPEPPAKSFSSPWDGGFKRMNWGWVPTARMAWWSPVAASFPNRASSPSGSS